MRNGSPEKRRSGIQVNGEALKRAHRIVQTAMLAGIIALCGATASHAAGSTTGDEQAIDSPFAFGEEFDDAWADETGESDLPESEVASSEEDIEGPFDDAAYEGGDWDDGSFGQIAYESEEGEEAAFDLDGFVPDTVMENGEMGSGAGGSDEDCRCASCAAVCNCAHENADDDKTVPEGQPAAKADQGTNDNEGGEKQGKAPEREEAASSSCATKGRDDCGDKGSADAVSETEGTGTSEEAANPSADKPKENRSEKTDLTGFIGGDYAAVMKALGQEEPTAQGAGTVITKKVSGVEIKAKSSEYGKRYLVSSLKVGSSSAYTLAGVKAATKGGDVPERLTTQGWKPVAAKEGEGVRRFEKGQHVITLETMGDSWSITLAPIEKPESGKMPEKSE